MKRTIMIGLGLVNLAILTACGAPSADQSSESKKIIGTNDLVAVTDKASNIPKKYRGIVDAVGRMSIGCTGTHIGDGLVITAGHCVLPMDSPTVEPVRHASCDGEKIEFGYRKSKKPYLVAKCLEVVVAELNDQRDYGIFKIDAVPPVAIELDTTHEAQVGQQITIFSHPSMWSLEWSKYCKVSEHQLVLSSSANQFTYQCDTEGGSSGSAVIDAQTLKIIGIHNGRGADNEPYNYATLATRLSPLQ